MNFSKALSDIFDAQQINELARSVGFVKRKRKICPVEFALSHISAKMTTLRGSLDSIISPLGITVTRQAVDQRYKPQAVVFIRELFQQVIEKTVLLNLNRVKQNPIIDRFASVTLIDSTSFDVDSKLAESFKGLRG